MLGTHELQWGKALRFQHPLLSLVAAPRPEQLISRLAHPVAVTALAVCAVLEGQQPALLLRQAHAMMAPSQAVLLATHGL